eukprot:2702097-Amphidinium_carterae.1
MSGTPDGCKGTIREGDGETMRTTGIFTAVSVLTQLESLKQTFWMPTLPFYHHGDNSRLPDRDRLITV